MGQYFDDLHESWQSQLTDADCNVADTLEIKLLRETTKDYDELVRLGAALSKHLRYKEAAEIYTMALEQRPNDLQATRLRAGRYLSTLQIAKARADFSKCLELGGEKVDIYYRLGLCCYYLKEYNSALEWWEACYPLCTDEMAIAVIYWHTVCSYRLGSIPTLLPHYHGNMQVGHHTAYQKAVHYYVHAGTMDISTILEQENDDLEYSIFAYGVAWHLFHIEQQDSCTQLLHSIVERDSFWPSFSFLAAWNDIDKDKGYNGKE